MMNKLAMVALLCLAPWTAQAQQLCAPPKIVKTTGTAEVKVTPDRAVIEIGVERQSATAKNAKTAVDDVSRKILAALKAQGVEDRDVQTAYLALQPMIDYRKGLRITNFTATQSLPSPSAIFPNSIASWMPSCPPEPIALTVSNTNRAS
jgi:uncharacterized protein YggE